MKDMAKDAILAVSEELRKNYAAPDCKEDEYDGRALTDPETVYRIIDDLRAITFPGYFNAGSPEPGNHSPEEILISLYGKLSSQISIVMNDNEKGEELTLSFIRQIPKVQAMLEKDVRAQIAGDPAAKSEQEVILAYPGLYAIFVYRYAHVLYELKVPLIPRVMSEYAHGRTGIDINPGATIGEYFFIDHGTGIVIGETAVIGNCVRIYQGVTIGALSTRKGHELSGIKRHPTIEDNVIIYANATILGGDTVVGENVTVAGNTFVTKSIPADSKVFAMLPELKVRKRQETGR